MIRINLKKDVFSIYVDISIDLVKDNNNVGMCIFADYRKWRRLRDYDPNALVLAVKAVKSGQMTALVASKFYGVPRTTIISRIQRNIE